MRPNRLVPSLALAAVAVVPLLTGLANCHAQDGDEPPPKIEDKEVETMDEDWTTTASGLRYRVIQAGKEGPFPKHGEKVTVHYVGTLEDGSVFDSSRRRGSPATFAVGQLIPGWNEALKLMTEGARWELDIPSDLGYGPGGSPPLIPPNARLRFDVELIKLVVMPKFEAPVAENQKALASGVKYEVLAEGKGEACGAEDGFELKYAFWSADGKLMGCSEQEGKNIQARAQDMQLPFLKEVPLLMNPGSIYRFEVPDAQGIRGRGTTIWRLEMVRVVKPIPVPEYVAVDGDDVKTTKSGLRYQVLSEGEGTSPKLGQTVKVHYAGWLPDGTLFDSSYSRGFETEFALGRVVPGWNEGLQLMKPGSKYRFELPPKLGYGARGAPPTIPPDATLVFLVEPISVAE